MTLHRLKPIHALFHGLKPFLRDKEGILNWVLHYILYIFNILATAIGIACTISMLALYFCQTHKNKTEMIQFLDHIIEIRQTVVRFVLKQKGLQGVK